MSSYNVVDYLLLKESPIFSKYVYRSQLSVFLTITQSFILSVGVKMLILIVNSNNQALIDIFACMTLAILWNDSISHENKKLS